MTNFRFFKTGHVVLWRVLSVHGVVSSSLLPLLYHRFTVLPTSHDFLALFVHSFELLRQSTMWLQLINYYTAFHPVLCRDAHNAAFLLLNSVYVNQHHRSQLLPFTIRFHFFKSAIFQPLPKKIYSSYSSFLGQSSSIQTFEPIDFFVLSSTSSFLKQYISQEHYAERTFP
jgi:hypothetical protein